MHVALLLLIAAPSEAVWTIGLGGAWSIPLDAQTNPWEGGKARQDFGGSLVVQRQGEAVVLQLELAAGGWMAGKPTWSGLAARVGVAGPPGKARPYGTAGLGLYGMTGPGGVCDASSGCETIEGSGLGGTAEAGVRIALSDEAAASPFAQVVMPFFGPRGKESGYEYHPEWLILLGFRFEFELGR